VTLHEAEFEIDCGDQLATRLQDLQYGADRRILLFTQDPTGLGGQISRRLLGLKLALLFERKVVFPHLDEPPYGQIFAPLHSHIDYADMIQSAVDLDAATADSCEIVKLDFWNVRKDPSLSAKISAYLPSEFRNSADPELHFTGALLDFCQLTQDMRDTVAQANSRLGIDSDTLGVHIRRGDKSVETPFVPIGVIREEIIRLCDRRGFRRVFACSDDPVIFEQLRLPAPIELVFDETEKRYNNANHRFLLKNPDMASEETRTAIKNIYLLGQCGAVIGQSNAHFARLAAAQITFRNAGASFGALIAGDHVLRHSPAMRVLYNGRHKLRAVARLIFPWMTMRRIGAKLRRADSR
jgi:hypothetical protein